MQRYPELRTRLLLDHLDRAGLVHVPPGHADHVRAALAGEKEKAEGGTLLRSERPPGLERGDLLIRPSVVLALRLLLDLEGRIIVTPRRIQIHGEADQDAQLLERIVGGAGAVDPLGDDSL